MKLLKISAAGVRGIVGRGMSAEVAMSFAQAFSSYLEGGSIALVRDSRPSGLFIRSAVLSGLLSCGSRVVDLGIAPTPALQYGLRELGVDGAMVIAAGHNPPEWNALRFIRGDGLFLAPFQGRELLEIYQHAEFRKAAWDQLQPLESKSSLLAGYRSGLAAFFDQKAIRERRFKVAVDCCNGPCSLVTPAFLESLGCEVVSINDDLRRPFPHPPNPTPANMGQLESLVKAVRADVGFAHDVEGERLGVVTEQGLSLHQEYTLALACWAVLAQNAPAATPQVIVTNQSTSRMIDDLARDHGAVCYRTSVGQAYVSEAVRQRNATVAGEGSGQVILPSFHPGPDGIAASALLLQAMARSGKTISELAGELPAYSMIKENIPLEPTALYRSLQQFRRAAGKESIGEVDLTDGVKITTDDGWVQVRASTTESQLRIIAEARLEARARELHRWAHQLLGTY